MPCRPPGRRTSCLQISGLKPERDLTSGNLLRLDELKIPASRFPTPRVPVNPTNGRAGQAKDPGITWAPTEGETKKLPVECGPPRDDQPHDLTRKFEYSWFEPANELTPATDATKDWKNLVDSSIRPKGICKSLPMADGHTYTLDCQEVAHYHSCNKLLVLFHLQSTSCISAPSAYPTQETADQLPKLYYPPGAPFGLVHFTEYPPNLAYLEFTLEEILIYNPEARTRETETVYREGAKITIPPLLFCNKCNYLPTYLVPMTSPLTLRPNHPQESVAANESTSTQIFGVMYITLTGLIDSMVPASGPWALLGKLLSYIVKLAPILWWALPTGPAGHLPTSSQEPPTGWIPDTHPQTRLLAHIDPTSDFLSNQLFGIFYITIIGLVIHCIIFGPWLILGLSSLITIKFQGLIFGVGHVYFPQTV
ncbi:hypothetical protein DSO57_1027212 [Entomophthora muscae]|uniref:Uncharacterized protein n=1 Tax=Entomophthora muscae TaxID=34485 RepID=A0ACC2UAX4_9FUNG|nr:hypothetical protein DSO57_1027212 [Entomophthora muscae]